ncbi:MAG: hypothetical protein ACFFD1_07810 [Candidatus Thorarchaeota archaeon]
MENYTQRAKLTCPICDKKFVPESFHIDKVIMDTQEGLLGIKIVSERNALNQTKIKPKNIVKKVWVTFCPDCGYTLRFIAEIAKKELVKKEEHTFYSFDEYGTHYFYNLYRFPKPYMDYTDYFDETIEDIVSDIKESLNNIQIEKLGSLSRGFYTEKVDPFKSLIRFYANLKEYFLSNIDESTKEMDLDQLFKESHFPKQLKEHLKDIRDLRNKVVHDSYDLSEADIELVKKAFQAFVYYLISSELAKLKLKNRIETIENGIIQKENVFWAIKKYLSDEVGDILVFPDYSNTILKPLLEDLEFPKNIL